MRIMAKRVALLALVISPGIAISVLASAADAPLKNVVPANPMKTAAPEQPIPYSHKRHLAMGLECKLCHVNPEPGNRMTFPATSVCMSCHQNIAKTKPDLAKLAEYAKSGEPIPWVRVYKLLPGPRWSHRPHLEAGAKCEMCHGAVSQMDHMQEVTSVTTMYSCLSCHQVNHAKTSCNTCHLWP
ncbi:MAG: cytochrome c3 family protein [Terriglobales bacterium]